MEEGFCVRKREDGVDLTNGRQGRHLVERTPTETEVRVNVQKEFCLRLLKSPRPHTLQDRKDFLQNITKLVNYRIL